MTAPRQDTLVSVLIDRPQGTVEELAEVARTLGQRFAFFEILLGIEQGTQAESWVVDVPHARALVLDERLTRHQRRVTLARAAIGDVIVFTARQGWDGRLLNDLCEAAEKAGTAYLRTQPHSLIDRPLEGLGRASNLIVDRGVSPVIAFARGQLEQALMREDNALALRFPPRQATVLLAGSGQSPPRDRGVKERMALFHNLATNTAPVLLTAAFWASITATVVGVATIAYAGIVYAFHTTIAPGWTTTTLLLGMVGMWGGILGAAVSAALLHLMPSYKQHGVQEIVSDVGKNDIFQAVRRNTNVVGTHTGGA